MSEGPGSNGIPTSDYKIEAVGPKHSGMRSGATDNGVRVTHLPTGIVVEIPHGFRYSQHRNLVAAMNMIEGVIQEQGDR